MGCSRHFVGQPLTDTSAGQNNSTIEAAERQFGLMCVRQMRPPGRGDFWILKIAYAPSDKNLSKNGSAHKGGSLCVKDVFAKKFLVPGAGAILNHERLAQRSAHVLSNQARQNVVAPRKRQIRSQRDASDRSEPSPARPRPS
jgi:hypothetical protein